MVRPNVDRAHIESKGRFCKRSKGQRGRTEGKRASGPSAHAWHVRLSPISRLTGLCDLHTRRTASRIAKIVLAITAARRGTAMIARLFRLLAEGSPVSKMPATHWLRLGSYPMKSVPYDYRPHAEQCLRIASEVTDEATASWFRMLGANYLEKAERAGQSKDPTPDRNRISSPSSSSGSKAHRNASRVPLRPTAARIRSKSATPSAPHTAPSPPEGSLAPSRSVERDPSSHGRGG